MFNFYGYDLLGSRRVGLHICESQAYEVTFSADGTVSSGVIDTETGYFIAW